MTGADAAAGVRVVCAGDAAIALEFAPRIDPRVHDHVTSTANELRRRWGAILRDVVAGYCSVTVYYDPLRIDGPWLEAEMMAAAERSEGSALAAGTLIEVPVCYDRDLAPDLEEVAAFAGSAAEDVVRWHSGRTYRVYMIGFLPGFPYLAEVDRRIAAPRRAAPRAAVPAGAVGIAGPQTGIYSFETPGGWNIIGRTTLKPWDPGRTEPSLFRPGDAVKFVPVSRDEFEATV